MILKELIISQFLLMGGCGGLERTEFSAFYTLGGCGGLERTDF